jgi:molybdate transport system substrate-binding protein
MNIGRILFLVMVSLAAAPAQPPAPLSIAAASDLQSILPALAERFERETGRRATLTFGSSGNFFSQIRNGAPFDLFFSADVEYPTWLEAAGLTEPGSRYPYGIGAIVLWTRSDSGLDLKRGLEVLTDARVRHIAIANPEHAPYGRAAVAALKHERLYDRVRAKFVLGENVSQAAQFVQSGNAEAGLIALSLARAPSLRNSGVYVAVPASFYPPIDQAAVILRTSRQKDAARQFLMFLGRPDIAQALTDAGFAAPRRVTVR